MDELVPAAPAGYGLKPGFVDPDAMYDPSVVSPTVERAKKRGDAAAKKAKKAAEEAAFAQAAAEEAAAFGASLASAGGDSIVTEPDLHYGATGLAGKVSATDALRR